MTLHIHRTPMKEIHREPHGEERWCFYERKRTTHSYVVMATVEPSYYDPEPDIVCDSCGHADADCFPGTYRTWGERL